MSNAFKCDICGDCIDNEADTKNRWIIASVNDTISETPIQIGIGLTLDSFDHVCNACRIRARNIILNWIITNFGS